MHFSESSGRIVLVILTKLFESIHGNVAIIFEEIQCLAAGPGFYDGIGSIELLCSICEDVDKNMNIFPCPEKMLCRASRQSHRAALIPS
jgi:hypothetical protein